MVKYFNYSMSPLLSFLASLKLELTVRRHIYHSNDYETHLILFNRTTCAYSGFYLNLLTQHSSAGKCFSVQKHYKSGLFFNFRAASRGSWIKQPSVMSRRRTNDSMTNHTVPTVHTTTQTFMCDSSNLTERFNRLFLQMLLRKVH